MTPLTEIQMLIAQHPDTAIRVFHGRGKAYPGLEHLNIEWYPPYLLVQNFSDGLDEDTLQSLSALFAQESRITAILLQYREWPEFKTEVLHQRESVELPLTTWVRLADRIETEIVLGKNRNTGAFLDMRAGWDWVSQQAHNKQVLNLFCYTGIFSLFALEGGAEQVDNVDMAANVLKIAQRNHQHNDLHDGKARFYKRNILKSARWFETRPAYDLVIVDPPPYQKKAFHGWKDYQKLLQLCRQCLAENGTLLTCLNNPGVSLSQFRQDLEATFPNARQLENVPMGAEIREADPEKGLKVVAVHF